MSYSTPSLTRLEDNAKAIVEESYNAAQRLIWANRLFTELPSTASAERLHFSVTTGGLSYGTEGNVSFGETDLKRMDFEPKFITAEGLRILKSELEDSNGAGFPKAAQWFSDRGKQIALFPQYLSAAFMRANPLCYDGQNFFDVDHPMADGSVFKNDLTGSASGAYPGALPLTGGAATAAANIAKAVSYVRSLLGPDGQTPRGLEPKYLVAPPALYNLALVACGAKFVGGTAGSTDITIQQSDFNLEVLMAPELTDDTSWYLGCEKTGTTVGGIVYVNREQCQIAMHGPQDSSTLAKTRVWEWTLGGRAIVGPGRPEYLFRCKAT